ncbi:MAG: hypothetical protein KDA31_12235 [Phycisphaerales bacterium]|nr:hypothetical protein [Phycisphaerales bacterium]
MSRTILPILLSLGFASSACADITVYSQPTTPDDSKVGLGFFSQSEPRANRNYKHADDFTLSTAATIDKVVWWGQSSKAVHADLTNFDSFLVEFYSVRTLAGAPVPDALLASYTFNPTDTSPVQTGRQTPNGAFEYRHEATLDTPFAAEADTRYFIAISAGMIQTTSASDAWQWQDASLVNGASGVYSWATRAWTGFQDTDSAFELISVPAPASAVPMASVFWYLYRRSRRD